MILSKSFMSSAWRGSIVWSISRLGGKKLQMGKNCRAEGGRLSPRLFVDEAVEGIGPNGKNP
ncbi:MAG TPA: hypothetical protein VGQ56_08205 [Gemmatimonadaceae bacterium]|jgi:hypothetical protein|nr:hypothetical protein [Gemmatimonadaceae bacterium]